MMPVEYRGNVSEDFITRLKEHGMKSAPVFKHFQACNEELTPLLTPKRNSRLTAYNMPFSARAAHPYHHKDGSILYGSIYLYPKNSINCFLAILYFMFYTFVVF